MKMLLAIVNREDTNEVCKNLVKNKFSITRLSTQGGFLMSGNTTILCGVEDDEVDKAIDIIKECSKQRTQLVPITSSYELGMSTSIPIEVTVGGATIFIFDVEKFIKV